MSDHIVRKLLDKVTGLPVTGKTVIAVLTLNPSESVAMPETPSGSGIYRTESEVTHGEYEIFVDDMNSNDLHTVEPSRFSRNLGTDSTVAFIDRALSSSVYLSSYAGAGPATSTHFGSALTEAIASNRALVVDVATAFGASVTVNGGTGTVVINAHATDIVIAPYALAVAGANLVIFGGEFTLPTGVEGISAGTVTMIGSNFVAGGNTQVGGSSEIDRYIGCQGITERYGASGSMACVVGSPAIGLADQLKLTDFGSDDGVGRRDALQTFIDDDMETITLNTGANGWLSTARKAEIAKLSDTMPTAMRNALAAGDLLSNNVKSAALVGTDADGKIVESNSAEFLNVSYASSDSVYSGYSSGSTLTISNRDYFVVYNASGNSSITVPVPSDPTYVKEITLMFESTTYSVTVTAKFGITGTDNVTFSGSWPANATLGRCVKLVWMPHSTHTGMWRILHAGGL